MTYAAVKRGLDVLGAVVLLVATLPIWACTAGVLLLVQGRPVLYRQQRAGRNGIPFLLKKFRTMHDGAPCRLPDRPVVKDPHDPRITPLGRFLRRFAIDELPQLLNVLRGEMSLVGPRPLPVEDLTQPGWLTSVDELERTRRLAWLTDRHRVLPGLTGLWQITPNAADDFSNWIICDQAYVTSVSFTRDCLILLKTPGAILRGRAAGQAAVVPHQTHDDEPETRRRAGLRHDRSAR